MDPKRNLLVLRLLAVNDAMGEESKHLEFLLESLTQVMSEEKKLQIQLKERAFHGSMDLDQFISMDLQENKLLERQELGKLMKEFNQTEARFKVARRENFVSKPFEKEKLDFDGYVFLKFIMFKLMLGVGRWVSGFQFKLMNGEEFAENKITIN